MADRIEAFSPTIPAGVSIVGALTFPLNFADGIVKGVDLRVPPGPLGLMGFVIAYAGTPIIPDGRGSWLVMNDEKWTYTLDNNPTGGQWQLIGYNTDIYNHTVYVRFMVDEFPPIAPRPAVAVPIGPGTAAVK